MNRKNKLRKKSFFHISIYQITVAGIMSSISVLLSLFTFSIGGGEIYLVGITIFLMPLVLRLPMLIISTIISIVVTDLLTGWIAYTWISCIAYVVAVIIIWLSISIITIKLFYFVGTIIAGGALIAIYYYLSMTIPVFDHAFIISETIGTTIEMAIVIPTVFILYLPFRLIPKGY